MATDRHLIWLLALGLGLAGPAMAEGPLSAIDWLSKSVTPQRGAKGSAADPRAKPGAAQPQAAKPGKAKPAPKRSSTDPDSLVPSPGSKLPRGTVLPASVPLPQRLPNEPAITKDAMPGTISAMVLGKPSPDGVGLLTPAQTGLPLKLWGLARSEDIARMITAERADTLPALQGLLMTLLLAEAEPPVDSGGRSILLLARIDKLLSMGALEQAMALTDLAGTQSPDLFRRRFDIALLTGTEDAACEEMQAAPHLAPTLPARVFCLARAGDWQAAALTLGTAQALGQVDPADEDLLLRFLDPAEADGAEPLPPPGHATPLVWRMYEAIGEPLPTLGLPVAFSHAELRPQAGWKARVEAGERLARLGAISSNQLLGLYTERRPAASGGVWDRIAAFQRFDRAMSLGAPEGIAAALPAAWDAMTSVELEAPFAQLYGDRLMQLALPEDAAALAFRIGLLSPAYQAVAKARAAAQPSPDLQDRFLIGLATGDLQGVTPPDSMSRAIAPAFLAPQLTEEAQRLLDERRVGEALFLALDMVGRGVYGDPRGVADGLSVLRKLGLEDTARRTAMELLLLERRG